MPHRGPRLGRSSRVLVATFNGTSAHQVGEGEMQRPFRGEVGLSQGPHTLAHLQKQLSTLSTHSPSPGQLQAVEGKARKARGMEEWVWSLSAASSVHQSQMAP